MIGNILKLEVEMIVLNFGRFIFWKDDFLVIEGLLVVEIFCRVMYIVKFKMFYNVYLVEMYSLSFLKGVFKMFIKI